MESLINEEGYYSGPEIFWNVTDVEYMLARAKQFYQVELSDDDYKRILVNAFEDNELLMDFMNKQILEAANRMLDDAYFERNNLSLKTDHKYGRRYLTIKQTQ